MKVPMMILAHEWGQCCLCDKDDRDVLHLKSEGTIDGKFCLRCTAKMVKLRQEANGKTEEQPGT